MNSPLLFAPPTQCVESAVEKNDKGVMEFSRGISEVLDIQSPSQPSLRRMEPKVYQLFSAYSDCCKCYYKYVFCYIYNIVSDISILLLYV